MRAAKFSIKINTGKGLRKWEGETSTKKGLYYDIVQIGWVSQSFKPHFFKNRNMDELKAWVGQNPMYSCFKKLVMQAKNF